MGIEASGTLDFENASDRRLSGLYLSLLDRMGVPMNSFGNSDEMLSEI